LLCAVFLIGRPGAAAEATFWVLLVLSVAFAGVDAWLTAHDRPARSRRSTGR
jgi:hypothetical protein